MRVEHEGRSYDISLGELDYHGQGRELPVAVDPRLPDGAIVFVRAAFDGTCDPSLNCPVITNHYHVHPFALERLGSPIV